MTPIDPASRSLQDAFIGGSDAPAFDPAAVLLALSAQQMGIMQSALVTQISGGMTQLSRIADLGSSAAKLSKLHDQAQQIELGQVNQVLAEVQSLKQTYMGGEDSSLVVNEADNERLNKLAEWAAQRGYELKPMTRWETPPVEDEPANDAGESGVDDGEAAESASAESDGAGAASEGDQTPAPEAKPDPQPQLVLDPVAVEENIKKLKAYLADLEAGAVDTPALRQTIATLPGMATLADQVRALGFTGPLDTLEQLKQASASLQQMADRAVAQLAEAAETIRQFASQITEKAADLTEFLDSFNDEQQRQTDRAQLAAQLQQLQLEEQFRRAMLDVQAQLDEAARLINSHYIPADIADRLLNKLSSVERRQLDNDLASWKFTFEAQLAASLTLAKPGPSSAASLRRNYL